MDFDITRISVKIKLSKSQWENLMQNENDWGNDIISEYEEIVSMLEHEGAIDVDFNGHFGANIFYQCDNARTAERLSFIVEEVVGKSCGNYSYYR